MQVQKNVCIFATSYKQRYNAHTKKTNTMTRELIKIGTIRRDYWSKNNPYLYKVSRINRFFDGAIRIELDAHTMKEYVESTGRFISITNKVGRESFNA